MSDGKPTRGTARRRAPMFITGWREWVALPGLGVARIKAKLDTGARSSALHAWKLERFSEGGAPWLRFQLHPEQRDDSLRIDCTAPMIDERAVKNTSGKPQIRPVIRTDLQIAGHHWPVEITLTRRDEMGFRMILGRTAMRGHIVVDSAHAFLAGDPRPLDDRPKTG